MDKKLYDDEFKDPEWTWDGKPSGSPSDEVAAKIKALPEPGRLALMMNGKGEVVRNAANLVRTFQNDPHYAEAIWFDRFYRRIMIKDRGVVRSITDADVIGLMIYLQNFAHYQSVSLKTVTEAVQHFAQINSRSEPEDWVGGLKWDGIRRVEQFMTDALGCDPSPYVAQVSANFWRGLAARILEPGCKYDNMVVIEGKQGLGKSTALSLIGGKYYGEIGAMFGTKDFYEALHGKLLVEIAELDSFSKSGEKTVKRVLSQRQDTYRQSYGRFTQDYPRTTLFVGTTNEEQYLEDATGGRRFWPIVATKIDLDLISRDRDQLFAEAANDYRQGLTWWAKPDGAEAIQASRQRVDSYREPIERWLSLPMNLIDSHFLMTDIIRKALEIPTGRVDTGTLMRVGVILRDVGFVKHDTTYKGQRGKWWVRQNP